MKKMLLNEIDKLKYRAYKIADLYGISECLNFATLLKYSKYKNSYHGDVHIYALMNIIHDLGMEEIDWPNKYIYPHIEELLVSAIFHDLGYFNPVNDTFNIDIALKFWNEYPKYISKEFPYNFELITNMINGSKYPFTNPPEISDPKFKDAVLTFRCIDHSMFILDPTLYAFLVSLLYKNEWGFTTDDFSKLRNKFLSYWDKIKETHYLVPVVGKKTDEFDIDDFMHNYLNNEHLEMYWDISLDLY